MLFGRFIAVSTRDHKKNWKVRPFFAVCIRRKKQQQHKMKSWRKKNKEKEKQQEKMCCVEGEKCNKMHKAIKNFACLNNEQIRIYCFFKMKA